MALYSSFAADDHTKRFRIYTIFYFSPHFLDDVPEVVLNIDRSYI